LLSLTIILLPVLTFASGAFRLESNSPALVGFVNTHVIKKGESLVELARTYDLGYNELTAANQGVDPWVPEPGTEIVIPTAWLIPFSEKNGIVINLAELRLYYFFLIRDERYVRTFPIGIGRQGFSTPEGKYRVTAKMKDPVWKVPEKIRAERPELPEFVLPGPDNPLGAYWIQLSLDGYGIHGTNRPYGIGRRVSHGCIRMYPEDIEVLFRYVRPGTKVTIVDMPVKSAVINGNAFIEVHRDDQAPLQLMDDLMNDPAGKRLLNLAGKEQLMKTIADSSGLPIRLYKNLTSSASTQRP
jgi:L,D-transpeptidase ErfK/SrfK